MADNEDLLEDLKRVAKKIGKSPTMKEYQEHGKHHAQSIANKHGWNKAKEKAGLDTNNSGGKNKASLDEIIQMLNEGYTMKEIANEYGYNGIGRISTRLNESGYTLRSKITRNKAAYNEDKIAGLLSIPNSVMEDLGFGESTEGSYYDMEVIEEHGRKGLKILFADDRVKVKEGDGE